MRKQPLENKKATLNCTWFLNSSSRRKLPFHVFKIIFKAGHWEREKEGRKNERKKEKETALPNASPVRAEKQHLVQIWTEFFDLALPSERPAEAEMVSVVTSVSLEPLSSEGSHPGESHPAGQLQSLPGAHCNRSGPCWCWRLRFAIWTVNSGLFLQSVKSLSTSRGPAALCWRVSRQGGHCAGLGQAQKESSYGGAILR